MLMKKNVSLYSQAEIQYLLSFKERQYAVRRERIKDYCSVQDDPLFGMKIDTLIYNPVDRVSYCPIAKVASSTWCNHFIKLGRTIETLLPLYRSKSLFCIIIMFFHQPMWLIRFTNNTRKLCKPWLPSYGPLLRCGKNIHYSVVLNGMYDTSFCWLKEDLQGSWNEDSNLSIVIVRHPMSRLASVYYQKFVQLGSKAWANVCITVMHLRI